MGAEFVSFIAVRVSIWSSTLGHFVYIGAILLAWPGLLGGSQHNIFRTRSLSAGVASEVMVKGRLFFCFHASSQIFMHGSLMQVGKASDDRRRGKQLSACSLDSSYGQLIGQQGNGLDFRVCKIIGGSVPNNLRACKVIW